MEWSVEYYRDSRGRQPVSDFIDSIPSAAQVKVLRTIKLLKQYGVLLKEPYTRHIRGKIREIRIADRRGLVRVLYFTVTGKRFILLHGFIKDTEKTPEQDIETAEKRMKDFIERGG
jgi:phage-related protein